MSGEFKYDISNISNFVKEVELEEIEPQVADAHDLLTGREGPGNEYTGWMDLPLKCYGGLLTEIEETGAFLRDNSEVMVVIGIGGSYLGAKALIDAVVPLSRRESIIFSGCDISGIGIEETLSRLEGRDFSVNVISKSGTTTEPAIAFRVIESELIRRYGPEKAKERIVCTTDISKGALNRIAEAKGYRTFVIPADVGGRFSVLSPVGLLPAAMAEVDIRELIEGANAEKKLVSVKDMYSNHAYLYAAVRNILYRKGKCIEIFSVFEPLLRHTVEWCKQLFGESEGKQHKGIFPAGCVFSTDLHSMGQLIQDGSRNLYETFILVDNEFSQCEVPMSNEDLDGLNYLAGMRVDFINKKAYEAAAKAHLDGGVPNSLISIGERSAYCMGRLFYFFQTAVAISAYISKVNPFDQPGVEAYKTEMFRLLGKPGYK